MSKDLEARSSKQVIEVSTQEGYDRWSQVYDTNENPLVILEEAVLYQELKDIRGLQFLDLGCGTGRHSLRLSSLGADVTGIDFSEGMLSIAKRKVNAERVQFHQHDLARPLPFVSESFDRVLCALVLDHVSDLSSLFSEMNRVCRPDGKVIITVMHPAVMLKGRQANFTDPETGAEIQPQSVPNLVSDYVMGILNADFKIIKMKEHCGDPKLAETSKKMKEYLNWPLLLTFELSPRKADWISK